MVFWYHHAMNKNSVVAVTGASGTIGKMVIKKLVERDFGVRALIREQSVNHWEKEKRVEVIRGDICDEKILTRLFDGVDGVIHLAVEMDSALPWEVFKLVNIDSVKMVLKLAPKKAKLVVASSVVVYDDTGRTIPQGETWKRRVDSTDKYVKSKIKALKIVEKSKRKVVSVMPATVVDHEIFGREQFITDNWILKWLWNNVGGGIPGGLMAAVGDRGRIMNFVEVRDVAEGVVLALLKGKVGEEYILSGENITSGEYLKKMAQKCHKNYLKVPIPHFFLKMFGLGNVVNMYFSNNKAKKELGYEPKWKI
jgi:nucleoside-diphosphate-sugar epimerase